MFNMKKYIILIGSILVVIIGLGFYFLFFYEKDESDKVLYLYHNELTDKYFVSDSDNNEIASLISKYDCKTKDCSFNPNQLLNEPYVLIKDTNYYIYDILKNVKTKLEIDSNIEYELINSFELIDEKTIVLFHRNYKEYLEKTDVKYVFIDLNTGKEKESIEEKDVNINFYPDLKILKHEKGNYYVTFVRHATNDSYSVYNHNFEKLDLGEKNRTYEIDLDGNLIVSNIVSTKIQHGYNNVLNYEVYDQSGNFVRKSKDYKAILAIDNFYLIAVDNDDVLKIFDLNDKEIVSLENWSNDKAFTYEFIDNRFEIIIDIPEDSLYKGNIYTYSVDTNELKKENYDAKLGGK